jgi:subtilisin family serine protease
MSRPSPRPRRLIALALVTVAGLLVPASVMAAGPKLKVPTARPDTPIVVTYRDDASFRKGGSSAAVQAQAFGAIDVKVFDPKPGQEAKAMRELAAGAGVVSIENDIEVETTATPNDRLWASYDRWAHDKIGLRRAWDTTRGSSNVIIAILDSGIDFKHPELAGRIVQGRDFANGDWSAYDDRGHGTMSAGVAAGRGGNRIGVAGACWGCRIMPIKVLNKNGTGYGSWVTKGIIWAADHGADVISMSFGGFKPTSSMASALAYARRKGAVLVASAGNEGNTKPFYPAAYPGVLSVAASNSADRPYSWSNRGAWVDLTAPGCLWTTHRFSKYGNFCGTSASAPLVSGVVGLVRSRNPKASVAEVERAILGTATPMSYVRSGRVNAAAAIKAIEPIRAYAERDGRVIIEAESTLTRVIRNDHRWAYRTGTAGYAGGGFLWAGRDSGLNIDAGYTTKSPEARYAVRFTTTGTYRIWARVWAPNGFGDTLHVGLDGRAIARGDRMTTKTYGRWVWTNLAMDGTRTALTIQTPGVHVVSLWMREDGLRVDRIILTRSRSTPGGIGPAESAGILVARP